MTARIPDGDRSAKVSAIPRSYLPRIDDRELDDRLRSRGAVFIEGPKACGKTWTALPRAASVVRLDVDAGARKATEVDPTLVLDGATPRHRRTT